MQTVTVVRKPSVVFLAFLLAGCGRADAQYICVTPQQYGPLPIGRTLTLFARQIDWFGDCRAVISADSWSSSDTAIARVSNTGVVEPVRTGAVTVTAQSRRGSGNYMITVVPPIQRIEIFPKDTTVGVGDTVTFRAVAYDAQGGVVPDVPFAFSDRQDGWNADSIGIRWRRRNVPGSLKLWSYQPSSGRVGVRIVGDSAVTRLTIRP